MHPNSQSRKWLLTINNPLDYGFSHATIKSLLHNFSVKYYCIVDEIASTGTLHTHVFIFLNSPTRFSTVQNRFNGAHIDKAYGSVAQIREYLLKSGKWAESEKAVTTVPDTFEEWGEIPSETEEKYGEVANLIEYIKAGMSNAEIIKENPKFWNRIKDIDILRQTLLSDKYEHEYRPVEVVYLYGATGTGKTRGIFEAHKAKNIYRVTNYRSGRGVNFDGYSIQDVLVFEEFNSQIPIEEMLNYLDVHPVELPARYNDKVACYTKVYITSNIPLEQQYMSVQESRPETWNAFCRRIKKVVEYKPDGTTIEHDLNGG